MDVSGVTADGRVVYSAGELSASGYLSRHHGNTTPHPRVPLSTATPPAPPSPCFQHGVWLSVSSRTRLVPVNYPFWKGREQFWQQRLLTCVFHLKVDNKNMVMKIQAINVPRTVKIFFYDKILIKQAAKVGRISESYSAMYGNGLNQTYTSFGNKVNVHIELKGPNSEGEHSVLKIRAMSKTMQARLKLTFTSEKEG